MNRANVCKANPTMADALTDPKTNLLLQCSVRVVTTVATFVAAMGTVVMGISQTSPTAAGAMGFSPAALAWIGVGLALVAWFASCLRYGAVMVACAVVGLIPWTRDWWKGEATDVGGTGLGL